MTYEWKANYEDGTSLPQYNEDGSKNIYTDIDRSKLVSFEILNLIEQKDEEGKVIKSEKKIIHNLKLAKGQRLICRQRKFMRNDMVNNIVWIVGWQQTVEGKNIQSIAYIYPDGKIEMSGSWKEYHPLFRKIELLPIEKEV